MAKHPAAGDTASADRRVPSGRIIGAIGVSGAAAAPERLRSPSLLIGAAVQLLDDQRQLRQGRVDLI
ncbi:MAG TPA: hypothetical protein VFH51_01290, partial [Myxococcota bacterium]|nr:hypothetical protein [Myxococcota bacterium]